jgi:hypothetical protein
MHLSYYQLNSQVKVFYIKALPCHLANALHKLFENSCPLQPRLQLIQRCKNREIFLFEDQDQAFYIKHFFAGSTAEKLKNIVLNKAVNSLRLSHRLMSTGFVVAEPVLAMKYQKIGESIYVTKKFAGVRLNDFLNSDIPETMKEKAMHQFITMIAGLFKNGFLHCDPTPTNFLIRENDDRYEFALIDLDAIIHLPRPVNILTYKNLAKLYTFSCALLESNSQLPEKALNYLRDFIGIYNSRLNFAKVQKIVGKMVAKRAAGL